MEELLPNCLTYYLSKLSQIFHRFCDKVPVVMAEGKSLLSALVPVHFIVMGICA